MFSGRTKEDSEAVQVQTVEAYAKQAGLKYVRDDQSGYSRRRAGKGFVYLNEEKKRITDEETLQRIRGLAIPPAWEKVWICRENRGHLQATGRDARKRKQYRYHALWSQARNETKFSRLAMFGECLPAIRARVEADLKKPGYPKEKILAAIVRVMELTNIRVGNDVYAEENKSYGLTTILNDHATVQGSEVKFKFKGKSGILHEVRFTDPQISRIIRKCQDLPGEELFAYEDENGQAHDIGSQDVNEYLHEITSQPVTAKDFRTWGGTVHALHVLAELGPCSKTTKKAWKEREMDCFRSTASSLRNTVAVCRKYYVHPGIFGADREGLLHKVFKKYGRRKAKDGLELEEMAALELLSKLQV